MVGRFRKRICGLVLLKRFIYLISPNKVNRSFYTSLDKVLSFKNVKFFSGAIKKTLVKKTFKHHTKDKKITAKHKVKLIINDNFILSSKIKANGCHMGQYDGSFKIAREILKGKILGITCHNSKILAKNAVKNKADYIAFGSFLNLNLNQVLKKQT